MAKVKILGVSRKTGTFEGHDYDNIMFHSVFIADGMIAGDAVKAYKLKTVRLLDAFEDSRCPQAVKEIKDLKQLVGHTVRLIMDDYGKYVDEVQFIK